MELLTQNLKWIRSDQGKTQEAFAELLGIKRASLGAYEEGRARPGYETLLRLAELAGCSVDQLLRFDLSKGMADRDKSDTRILAITVNPEGRENIELVPHKAAAGYTAGYADTGYLEELPHFGLPFLQQGTFRAFEIRGDSMPPLETGSIVVAEYLDDWKHVEEGAAHIVVSREDGIVYKRIFRRGKNWELRSDNPEYEPYSLDRGEILELWKGTLHITRADGSPGASLHKLAGMVASLNEELKSRKNKKA